jgi:hypothetical protein
MIPRPGGKGKAMPRHDPIPRSRGPFPNDAEEGEETRAAEAWARYRRMMRWMALAAAAAVALSLLWLKQAGGPMPFHMVVATAAGVGLTVLVGTALMGLVFLSSRSGHDEEATRGEWNDDGGR